jgi:type VI protein secretion system component VasF
MLFVDLPRACFLSEIRTDPKGKARKIYRYERMMTRYDELKSLPRATVQLNPLVTFAVLEAIAHQLSDTQAADRLQKTRLQLLTTIHDRTQNAN